MSGAELAGNLVDAGLTAHAVEPHSAATGMADGHTHETACLNCTAKLTGPFCNQCGQAAHVHRTLAAFFHDLLHGVFHFEGRVWDTLPMLLLHPGELTRRYIEGQRARYVSPLALFLFCVFVMFAVIQQTSDGENSTNLHIKVGKPMASPISVHVQLDKLVAQHDLLAKQHEATDDVDTQIAALRAVDGVVKPAKDGSVNVVTGISAIDAGIAKIKANPELAAYKIETHAYKYSWLLIPISVPFIWLLFPFSRRFKMYDHTVFVTYSLCFMTLLSVVAIAANALGLDLAVVVLVFLPPVHMYRQLRGAYGCSRIGALLRTMALVAIAGTALSIFAVLIIAQSAG